jgi:hypothetical protein
MGQSLPDAVESPPVDPCSDAAGDRWPPGNLTGSGSKPSRQWPGPRRMRMPAISQTIANKAAACRRVGRLRRQPLPRPLCGRDPPSCRRRRAPPWRYPPAPARSIQSFSSSRQFRLILRRTTGAMFPDDAARRRLCCRAVAEAACCRANGAKTETNSKPKR